MVLMSLDSKDYCEGNVHCYELSRLCRAFYYYFVGNDDLPFELDLDEIDLSTWDSAMVSRLKQILFILCIMHRKYKRI